MNQEKAAAVLQLLRKKANWADDIWGTGLVDAANSVAENNAAKAILGTGALALGGGAAIRGIQHLMARSKPAPKYNFGPPQLELPYLAKYKEEDKPVAGMPVKQAMWPFDMGNGRGLDTVPWAYAGMAGAGIAGIPLGYKAMDSVLTQGKDEQRKAEIEKAKQEFNAALLSNYRKPLAFNPATKTAADTTMEKVGQVIDDFLDKLFEKKAGTGVSSFLGDLFDLGAHGKRLANVAGGYAATTGLLGAYLGYNHAMDSSKDKVLQDAMKKRDLLRLQNAPLEITPVPYVENPQDKERQVAGLG